MKLPVGYTPLLYIESTGVQWADSGVIPDQDTRIVMDVELLIAKTATFFGVCAATDGGEVIKIFNLDMSITEIGKDQTFTGVEVKTDSVVTEVRVTAHTYKEHSNGDVEVDGVKYSDVTEIFSVTNPDVTANDKQNVKEFQTATLVSPAIAQAVAQRVYNWYLRRNTSMAGIVWKGESLGDYVSLSNNWGSSNVGSITKMEIKLSNTVVAKCEAVGQGG